MDNKMGTRIHEKRLEKELTMEQLGELCGVQKSAVNKWEKGMVENMKRSTIARLASVLECSPAWLMGIDDEEGTEMFEAGRQDAELLKKYHSLTKEHQQMVLNQISIFLEMENKG